MVHFTVEKKQEEALDKVIQRALGIAGINGITYGHVDMRMDLSATHANGNPIDFIRMAEADDFNLAHDVFGIRRHLDRSTGKLGDCFSPRFSMPAKKDHSVVKKNYKAKTKGKATAFKG